MSKQKSIEEIKSEYSRQWNNGEFEWNHHEGDKIGVKPISPERIWNVFIAPTLQSERDRAEEELKSTLQEIQKVWWEDGSTPAFNLLDKKITALTNPQDKQ